MKMVPAISFLFSPIPFFFIHTDIFYITCFINFGESNRPTNQPTNQSTNQPTHDPNDGQGLLKICEGAKLHFDVIEHSPSYSETMNILISAIFYESITDQRMGGLRTNQGTDKQSHRDARTCLKTN